MNHPYVNIAVLLSAAPSATIPAPTPPSSPSSPSSPYRHYFASTCGLAENLSPILGDSELASSTASDSVVTFDAHIDLTVDTLNEANRAFFGKI